MKVQCWGWKFSMHKIKILLWIDKETPQEKNNQGYEQKFTEEQFQIANRIWKKLKITTGKENMNKSNSQLWSYKHC